MKTVDDVLDVVVLGSIRYGARAMVVTGSDWPLGAPRATVNPKTVQSTSPISFSAKYVIFSPKVWADPNLRLPC